MSLYVIPRATSAFILTATLVAALAASSAVAQAPATVDGSRVDVPGVTTRPIEVGCTAEGALLDGSRLYVACGDAGIVVFDLTDPEAPRVVERGRLPGRAVGFALAGDRVFVTFEQTTARPVDEIALTSDALALSPDVASGTSPAAPAAAPSAGSSGAARGDVLEEGDGTFVASIGSDDGVRVGDRVAVVRTVTRPDLEGRSVEAEEILAVGRVVETSAHRAEVELGLNERAPVGATVRVTEDALTASRVAPPPAGHPVELSATIRPFLPLGDVGLGLLGDFTAVARHGSFMARLQFDTLGVGVGLGDPRGYFSGTAILAYEHPFFAAGVGAGVMWNQEATWDASNRDQFGPAFSMAQYVRFGAADGLMLSITNHVALVDDGRCTGGFNGIPVSCESDREFHWAALFVDARVPILPRAALVARGGGGKTGTLSVEGGLRLVVRGNGGRGSLFLTPLLGASRLRGTNGQRNAGPSVALNVEWRP